MNPETTLVVLDTCVLMPLRLSDVLMDLRLEQLFSLHWTAEIEAEYLKNMLKAFEFPRAAVEGRLRAMRRRCPEWEVYVSAKGRARVPAKVDAKDRHIAAAALDLRRFADEESDKATYDVFLVTDNVRHFAKGEMAKLGVKVTKAGAFLDAVYEEHPAQAERAVQRAVSDLKDPPYTHAELLAALKRHGAQQLVKGLAARWGVEPVERVATKSRRQKR